MRTIAFTTSHWNDIEDARRPEIVDPLFGLKAWENRASFLFKPESLILGCGTWSNPEFSPLCGSAKVVNAGIEPGESYDIFRRQYWMAATMAVMAQVINSREWDLAVFLDTDCLVGSVDFPHVFSEFLRRPEEILSPEWSGTPGGPLLAMKRAACVRLFNRRIQGNMVVSEDAGNLMLGENEIEVIFRGLWWNPWPGMRVRQDFNLHTDCVADEYMESPFVRRPHPDLIRPYLETQWSKSVPLPLP